MGSVHRHQRLVPDQRNRSYFISVCMAAQLYLLQSALISPRCLFRLHNSSREQPDGSQQPGNVAQCDWFDHKNSQTEFLQLFDTGWGGTAVPANDKIGAQRDDSFQIKTRCVPYLRKESGGGRIVAVTADTYQSGASASRKDQFGDIRGKRNNATSRMAHEDITPAIIGNLDRGNRGRGNSQRLCRSCGSGNRRENRR